MITIRYDDDTIDGAMITMRFDRWCDDYDSIDDDTIDGAMTMTTMR